MKCNLTVNDSIFSKVIKGAKPTQRQVSFSVSFSSQASFPHPPLQLLTFLDLCQHSKNMRAFK